MTSKFSFRDPELVIGEIGPPITEAQIREVVPEEFPGKEDFVAFYSTYNGPDIPDSALFYRHRFYDVAPGDYDRLSVITFWFIPRFPGEKHHFLVLMIRVREAMARMRPDLREFGATHLSVACDASGNDFWTEFKTGRIKYRALEDFDGPDDLVEAAPSFLDFVSNLEHRTNQRPSRV